MSETEDSAMPRGGQQAQSRRALLIGAGVTCAAALAGCTTYDANNGGLAGPAPTTGGAATSGSAAAPSAASTGAASGSAAPAAAALATTAEVPEGGGKIIDGKNIVITQPQAGSFKAFTAVCTHQGCLVTQVTGGSIVCPCHGSKFSIEDGSPQAGPAQSALASKKVTVEGDQISVS